MNKNDYIRDLNKVKTTDSMKKRLMDVANGKEVDDSIRNIKHTRIIGLVASLALFLTVGAVALTLGTGQGNNTGTTQVGGEYGKDTTIETTVEIETESTINHDEQPTGEQASGLDGLMYDYNVLRDLEINVGISKTDGSIRVEIINKSEDLDYKFDNMVTFSHLEGNIHVATGVSQCLNENVERFTVKANSSKEIYFSREDVSNTKDLEDFQGSNIFGITFRHIYTESPVSSALLSEPVKTTFAVGEDNSANANEISISTNCIGDDKFTTSLINKSDEDVIYGDNRILYEYNYLEDVWYEVPVSQTDLDSSEKVLAPSENISIDIDLIYNYIDYTFKDTEYCMTNHVKTNAGKIMYVEYFRFGMEQGQKMLISTDTENDLIVTKAEHMKEISVSPYAIGFEVLNLSDEMCFTGEEYNIYKYDVKSNDYIDVPMKEDANWHDIAYEVSPNSEYEFSIYLDILYDVDNFNDGLYKVVKRFGNKDYILMRFIINEGEFEIYENAKHNDVFCKDASYSVSSGDYKYCIDVTFVNISDEINGTGDAFYIYKFNAETNEYEQVLWKDDTYYINVEPTINVKDIYSTQFYLDKIYDIDNMENGLYIIEKDFQDRLVTVGEFIMVNGNLTFCY